MALERTRGFVNRLSDLDLLASFESSVYGLLFLKKNKVDLVFLDIRMDEISGIQLLETLNTESEVIITTAYDTYALKGYDLNVTDYLLKPFTFERFIQAVGKAQNNILKNDEPGQKFIFVKTEYRLEKILLSEIIYIEGMRDYRRIHTVDKRIMTLQTFREFEERIPKNIVCRVHKSFMVAVEKIISIERDRIKLKDVLIPISETYKKDFLVAINGKKFKA